MHCFCGFKMDRIKINKDEFYDCPNCQYLRRIDLVSPKLEKERYDKHICDASYIKYMESIYLEIEKYIYGNDILDYGCGQIHALSDILKENGYNSDYYDLYYYPKLENRKYDTIILIEVFEHIANPVLELRKIKDMLNINGRIIIATNFRAKELNNWWYLRDKTHVSIFSSDSIKYLSDKLGFKYEIIYERNLIILTSI